MFCKILIRNFDENFYASFIRGEIDIRKITPAKKKKKKRKSLFLSIQMNLLLKLYDMIIMSSSGKSAQI